MNKRIDVKARSGSVETHTVSQDTSIQVHGGSEIRLFAAQGDIASMERQGEDLIIKYADGTSVRLEGYFGCPADSIPTLVLDDASDPSHAGQLYKAQIDPAACFPAGDRTGGAVAYTWAPLAEQGSGLLTPLLVLGGLAAAGGVAAAAASGGGGGGGGGGGDPHPGSPAGPTSAAAPLAPTAHFSPDGCTVVGRAAPNATVQITGPSGQVLGTGTADASGSYSVPLIAPATNGENVDVTQTTSGGTSPATTVTAPDLTAPDAPAITSVIDDAGIVTGAVSSGGATADTTPTLQGIAEAGSTVTVYDNGTAIGTAVADDSGNWTLTPTTPLAEGPHSITATSTDAAGNTSPARGAFDVTVDTTAPGAPTVNPTDGVAGSDLSGTAEPGSTVNIDVSGDGQPDYTTTADGSGHWSVPIGTALPGGTTVSATATDPAGNTSGPGTVTVDVAAPAAPAITSVTDDVALVTGPIASGDLTNDATPTLSGTAEPGSTVTVYDGTTAIGTATADASGNWTLTPTTPLPDGTHDITATATDAAGNTGPASTAYGLTIDTKAPAAPAITGVTGDAAPGASTNDSTPTLTGTAEPNSTVTVYEGTTALGTATADASGNWSFTSTTALTDGTHDITATATDPAGNTSPASTPYVLTVDTMPPAAPAITSADDDFGALQGPVASGGTTNDATPTLSGMAEPGSTVTVYEGTTAIGSTTADASGTWTLTPTTPLYDGAHSFTATSSDAAGNTSAASQPYDLSVDTMTPVSPAIMWADDNVGPDQSPVSSGGTTDDSTPTIVGTAEPNSTVTVYDGATVIGTTTADASGNWTLTPTTPLDNGMHDISATNTDAAGNTSAPSPALGLIVDAPTLTITMATDDLGPVRGAVAPGGTTDDTTPTLSGTAKAGAVVTVFDGSSEIGSTTADASGNWTLTPTTPLTDGIHSFTATSSGDAVTSDTYVLTVDTRGPAAPAITGVDDDVAPVSGNVASGGSTNDTTPTLSGTAEPNSTVTVYDGAVTIGKGTADTSGKWTLTPTAPLGDGTHDFIATATDKAGNTGPASAPYTLTVDTQAPFAPAITGADDDVAPATGNVASGGKTNDATPTLSGTAEPNSTVTVYEGTTAIGSTAADASGTWTLTPTTPLTDGTHSFTVTATDAAGNSTAGNTYALTVPVTPVIVTATDDVGPITGTVLTGGATDDTTPTLSGTAAAGSVVYICDGVTGLSTVTVDASGHWSFTTPTLGAGAHAFTVKVSDAAGNFIATSNGYDVNVVIGDTLDAVDNTMTLDAGNETIIAGPVTTTRDEQVIGIASPTGSADANASFTIAPNSSGTVHITVTQQALAAVANAYAIEVVDAYGNVVYAASNDPALVAGVGTIGVLGLVGNDGLSADVSGLAAGTYHVVVVNDESRLNTLLDSSGDSSVSLQELGNSGVVIGANNETVIVNAIESALGGGMLGATVGGLLTAVLDGVVDNVTQATPVSALAGMIGDVLGNSTVAPLLSAAGLNVTGALDQILTSVSDALLSNTLTLLQNTTITTQVDQHAFTNGSLTGNVIADANDPAGNDNVGTTPGGATVTGITFNGTTVAVDPTNGATLQGAYGSLHIDADGSYTYTASGDPASIGHADSFAYTLSDGVLSDTAALTINIVDTTPPAEVPTITSLSDDTGTTLTGWATTENSTTVHGALDTALSAGEKLMVSIDGGAFTEACIDPGNPAGTSWFYGTGALADGTHTVTVEIVDQAGNVDTHAATQTFTTNTANAAPLVGIDDGLLGGLAGASVLGLLDLGNQTFVAGDPDNNLKSVSVQYSVPLDVGFSFDLTASQALAAELGLQIDVVHVPFSSDVFPPSLTPESSTLTITAIGGGAMSNQAVLELLDSVYLDAPLNVGLSPTYAIEAIDINDLSATASTTDLVDLGLGSTPPSSVIVDTTAGATVAGTSADEHVYGLGIGSTIHGGDGNDLIRGGNGSSLYGDAGNDVLVYKATDIVIDGGDGNDTLLIEDAVASITGASTPVTNIEHIQLADDTAAHTLNLDAAGAKAAVGAGTELTINGTSLDIVNLSGATHTGQMLVNNQAYEAYAMGAMTVLIQDQIHVNAV